MTAGAHREGAKASDPVLTLIAEHKALAAAMEVTVQERDAAEAAEFQRQGDRYNDVLASIETTTPTTPEGLAASIRYYAELRSGFSLNDDAWLETLASAARPVPIDNDPVLGMIATYRAHQAEYIASPEQSPESQAAFDAMYRVVGLVARTIPGTFAGLAASAALFAEMLEADELASGDDGGDVAAWTATLKMAAERSIPDPVFAALERVQDVCARDWEGTPETAPAYQALEAELSEADTALARCEPTTGPGLASALERYFEPEWGSLTEHETIWIKTIIRAAGRL